MHDERISDADLVIAQSLRLTELDVQIAAIDVAHRKAVQSVRELLDAHRVPLEERLRSTIALAELAATISLARGQVRPPARPGKSETVRVGPADGRCCARQSTTGRRCTNPIPRDRLSICAAAPDHAWEQPTPAQVEAGLTGQRPNLRLVTGERTQTKE